METRHRGSAGVSPLLPLDGGDGPAVPLSDDEAAVLAQRVLERAQPPRRRRSLPGVLAAAILIAGGAALATTSGPWRSAPEGKGVEPVSGERANPASANQPPRGRHTTASKPIEPKPKPVAAAVSSSTAAARPSARPQLATEDLLARANELRGQGQWHAAERAYARVRRTAPGSPQAYVATLAAASLRLEHLDDPAGALRLYQSMLAGGSLTSEALFGAASCYRQLGDAAGEARALRQFLASKPSRLLREQAEARLRELETK